MFKELLTKFFDCDRCCGCGHQYEVIRYGTVVTGPTGATGATGPRGATGATEHVS